MVQPHASGPSGPATDYSERMKLVDYNKSRLVVRISNAHATVQIVDYAPEGDITVASAVSKQLADYGYLGSTANLPAFYLTAYLCAKRALANGVESAILDIGLKAPIYLRKMVILTRIDY